LLKSVSDYLGAIGRPARRQAGFDREIAPER
jgi:hypothetical protein